MVTEVLSAAPVYVVDGEGPYLIPHEYNAGSIAVRIDIDGVLTDLTVDEFSVDPASSEIGGNVFLSTAAATAHDGATLFISRETAVQQGWAGVNGSRERSLEQQLDAHTRAIQDITAALKSTVRVEPRRGSLPALPQTSPARAGRALVWDTNGNALAVGPTAGEIAGAEAAAGRSEAAAYRAEVYGARTFDGLGQLEDDVGLTAANTVVGASVAIRGVGDFVRVASDGDVVTAGGLHFNASVHHSEQVRPEFFGAQSMDDTELFERAAARSPYIFLTPGREYRIADWVPPSGTTIYSKRGMGHFSGLNGKPPILRRANGAGVGCLIDTTGVRELSLRGFHMKGGSTDGHVYDAHLVRVGGYLITMEALTMYEGLTGYGGDSGQYGQNTQIVHTRIGNCGIGVTRVVDTTMTAGSITGCLSHGIYFNGGSNFNNFRTRVEWCGRGNATHGFSEGHGVWVSGANDLILDLTVDRNWLSGVAVYATENSDIRAICRRNGASGGTFEGRSHLYLKQAKNSHFHVMTEIGEDDGGGGIVSPQYSVHFDNGGTGLVNVMVTGDLSGAVTAPVLRSNGASDTVNLLATAAGEDFTLGGVAMGDGSVTAETADLGQLTIAAGAIVLSEFSTGNIAITSGTAAGNLHLPKLAALTSRTVTLAVNLRSAATNTQNWYAEFPVIVSQGSDGTAPLVTFGSAAREIIYGGGSGYIGIGGSGTFRVAFGTIDFSGADYLIPVTLTNTSGTVQHKAFVSLKP